MPKWGLTMKKGKLTRWFFQEGASVKKGEMLFEVETDKIVNSVESPGDGTLFQIIVPEGDTVPVQAVVGIIAASGETLEKVSGGQEASAPEAEPAKKAASSGSASAVFVPASPIARKLAKEWNIDLADVTGTGPKGRVVESDVKEYHEQKPAAAEGPDISPQARALAEESGLDISKIEGSGPGGKITKIDVLRAMTPDAGAQSSGPAASSGEGSHVRSTIPMEGMRKLVADNMMASLHGAAQLTTFVEIDATKMDRLRDKLRLKYKRDETFRLSYNDIICLAACRALAKHPIMNSTLEADEILLHDEVNLGLAVSLDRGLIVPNIKNAGALTLLQMAKATRDVASRARKGGLSMDEIGGGTFTISNVSMLGVDGFTPILNPPETGILGVGRVISKPAVHRGEICIRKMMTLSLTFDHRTVDGDKAMSFLRTLGDYLEDPGMMVE